MSLGEKRVYTYKLSLVIEQWASRVTRVNWSLRLDDLWASLFPASLPPASGLTADSCSYGRGFASRFFRLRLTTTPCGSATVAVTGSGWLLSSNKTLPMLGTLAHALLRAVPALLPAPAFRLAQAFTRV